VGCEEISCTVKRTAGVFRCWLLGARARVGTHVRTVRAALDPPHRRSRNDRYAPVVTMNRDRRYAPVVRATTSNFEATRPPDAATRPRAPRRRCQQRPRLWTTFSNRRDMLGRQQPTATDSNRQQPDSTAISNSNLRSGGPQSATRNPQSAIRNPQSAIRNPQSATRTTRPGGLLTARRGEEA
jgi:hypothetical protein